MRIPSNNKYRKEWLAKDVGTAIHKSIVVSFLPTWSLFYFYVFCNLFLFFFGGGGGGGGGNVPCRHVFL